MKDYIIELSDWSLTVEDWRAGNKRTVTEDRENGHCTSEVFFETEKTLIDVGNTPLVPWADIGKVGKYVSGTGCYRTSFTLPGDIRKNTEAVLELGSFNGCPCSVNVNGMACRDVCQQSARADISGMLVPGKNTVLVKMYTPLNNRLVSMNYYERGVELSMKLCSDANNANNRPRDYHCFVLDTALRPFGLTGKTFIRIKL